MSHTCLNSLSNIFSPFKRKRVGRGIGSGKGKTCGRGHKGQKSRSGVSINGFQGGQMPIFRCIPKRGFKSLKPSSYEIVTIESIADLLNKNTEVSLINNQILFENGLIKKIDTPVKVIGSVFAHKKIKFSVAYYSSGAKKVLISNDCDLG